MKETKKENMVRLNTYVLPSQKKAIKKIAKITKVTEGEVFRQAVDQFIGNGKSN